MPRLTEIADPVSQQVRAQYEESPYPRWVTVAPTPPEAEHHRPICADCFRTLRCATFAEPATPDILVAGCGTGQQPIGTAQRFPQGAHAGDRSQPREPCLCQAQVRCGRRRDRICAGRHSRARAGPAFRHDRVERRAASPRRADARLVDAGRRCSSPAGSCGSGFTARSGAGTSSRCNASSPSAAMRRRSTTSGAAVRISSRSRRRVSCRSCIRRTSTAPAPAAICCSTFRSTG